jgi:hypothetical protein
VLPRWVLIGVNSFLILIALAAVFGIWFGRTAAAKVDTSASRA